jgi:GDPmannose 4,6-dehydratase
MSTNKERCLITGISGQDGSYLSEYLLELGYEVHGIVRRHSVAKNQDNRLSHLVGKINTHYGDLTDTPSLTKALQEIKPDYVFNLAAQSHVGISSFMPEFTCQVNSIGVLNLLEQCRQIVPKVRFYQASSSEMFGSSVDEDKFQRETTPMHPVSPYGVSKLFAYHMVRHYRSAYKMFASNGILFNHESPRRGENFVTQKIVQGALAIKTGKLDILRLGNLHAYRDWGHAKDYVRAMHAILEYPVPEDFVVATGDTYTIAEFGKAVFEKLGLNWETQCTAGNAEFIRPQELDYLRGDSSKARKALGWKPTYTFNTLIEDMINEGSHTI